MKVSSKHYLPSKVNSYLRRLELEYARADSTLLRQVVTSARIAVIEETFYDNWNGGTYGHDVILFLPAEVLTKISLDKQKGLCDQIALDLNVCANAIDNESVRSVIIELFDDSDPLFQKATALTEQPQTDPDTLCIWRPGHVRLFISHRDTKKAEAKRLAEALESYGVSAFVAHDTIEPMSSWQQEIEKGLETMEVMLAFITDDFHDSCWTNQEIGYALGKGILVIPFKVEKRDPFGFIGTKQALKGRMDEPEACVKDIYAILSEKLGQKGRLQTAIISAFVQSLNFEETRDRFDRMDCVVEVLSDTEFAQIQAGFSRNNQLYNSYYLNNNSYRLRKFLERCTGKQIEIEGRNIGIKNVTADNEIPF
jgi:hypothetical protein